MNRPKKLLVGRWLVRAALLVLALAPLIYWQPFYVHFYTYLTGTIITGIIKSQWQLVLFSILLFMIFIVPLTYRKQAKWLDYGLISAFFVSLFIEMYGIPLTILLASKYLFVPGIKLPADVVEFNFLGVDIGMDHAMVYGTVLIIIGMGLIVFGWWSLYHQSKHNNFAQKGLYAISRHPQYIGFILLIIGWFFGWPTILTLFFSPILIYKYIKAAQAEEKELTERFGAAYQEYRRETPFLI
jgi:protein-S-isoprenylcysteine O-methyltransferase Ste14